MIFGSVNQAVDSNGRSLLLFMISTGAPHKYMPSIFIGTPVLVDLTLDHNDTSVGYFEPLFIRKKKV